MSQDLKELLVDVRDRVIRIETRLEAYPELQREVRENREEILKAKTSVKVVRWILGLMFLTAPGMTYAIMRIFGKA